MITARQVLDHVTAEPFQPFRINMASGRTFEVRHPEMVKIGKSSLTIYTVVEDSQTNGHRWHDVSLMLLESIESLDAQIGSAGG